MMTEQLYKDYTKCLLYPSYAIEKYFRLLDSNGRAIPFKLNDNQKRLVGNLDIYRLNIAKTSRGVGTSSILAAWVAVKLAFSDAVDAELITYISQNRSQGEHFISEVKFFLNFLPRWIWGEDYYNDPTKSIFKINKITEIVLPNSARLKIPTSTPDGFRGYRPTHLILDNAAYITKGAEIVSVMMATLGATGKATIISTPSGTDEFFKPLYEESMIMRNEFTVIDMLWPYDSRFNEGLVWAKDGETFYEEDFTEKSISKMLYNKWNPSSPWYEQIANRYRQAPKFLDQEYNGVFL